MKHVGTELKRLIEEKHLVKKEVAEMVGITPTYLSAIMHKDSIDCLLLERICKALGVPASHFFDESGTVAVSSVTANTVIGDANAAVTVTPNEVATLRELLAEKERTIQILMALNGTAAGQDR